MDLGGRLEWMPSMGALPLQAQCQNRVALLYTKRRAAVVVSAARYL